MGRRVLIVTERFHPEDFRINELARKWADRGMDVRVLSQVPSYPQGILPSGWSNRAVDNEDWDGTSIRRVRTVTGYANSLKRKLLNYLSFMLRASWRALASEPRPDVIFAFQTGPLTSAFPAALAGWLRRVPVVIWTQDLWPDSVYAYGFRKTVLLRIPLDAFVRFVYRRCAVVLVSCRGFADRLNDYTHREQPIHYLANWAQDLDLTGEAVTLGDGRKCHFTFAGNLGKVQNLDGLLDAWKGLDDESIASAQLNLIGEGSHLRELQRRVEAESIAGVRFWGRVNPAEIGGWYRGSDVLVISLQDTPLFKLTVPSKFQTYLAAGRPILAAVGGEVNRLVREEGIGLTAEPGDTEDIRRCFHEFIASSLEERATMAAGAKHLLEREFSRERNMSVLEQAVMDPAAFERKAHA